LKHGVGPDFGFRHVEMLDCNFDDLQKIDCSSTAASALQNKTLRETLREILRETLGETLGGDQAVEIQSGEIDKGLCLAKLESACNASDECIGFNWPGRILKKACSSVLKVPGTDSTYFKVSQCILYYTIAVHSIAVHTVLHYRSA
jgi:hypothetical protein